jgi:quercetin dioxygenase-like cupin family protein
MANRLKAFTLLLGVSVTTIVASQVLAQQQSPSANQTQTTKRTVLHKVDVPGANYEVLFVMVEIPSNTKVPRHTHPGAVFAYLLEGDYQLVIDGQPAKQYKPGETFEIAPGVPHAELIGEKPMKALVTFTVEKGKPLTSSAE